MKSISAQWWVGCVLALSLVASPSVSRADETTDKAAAEGLYQLGHRLMGEGKFADACPKLEASQELDPGVGTLLLLGDCQEKVGKLASAWSSFQAASALARARSDAERAGIADLRSSALKPRLSWVSFDASANAELSGFELRRSGHVVGPGAWGVSLPIDPGTYEVTASAPGHEAWRTTLNVPAEASEPLVLHVPRLAETRDVNARPPSAPGASSPSEPDRSGSPQKTVGVVTLGVGVGAAITGAVLTYVAWKKNHDSIGHCERDSPNLCDPSGVSERGDARQFANIATFVGIGAAVAIGGGTVLYLTAPRGEPSDHARLSGFSLGYSSTF